MALTLERKNFANLFASGITATQAACIIRKAIKLVRRKDGSIEMQVDIGAAKCECEVPLNWLVVHCKRPPCV